MAVPTYIATSTSGAISQTASTDLTCSYPAGSASGDFLLLVCRYARTAAGAYTVATPSGWTVLSSVTQNPSGASDGTAIYVFYRFRGAETSVTTVASNGTSTYGYLYIEAYTGSTVAPTNSINAAASTYVNTSSTTNDTPTITTTKDDCAIAGLVTSARSASQVAYTFSWTGATERNDSANGSAIHNSAFGITDATTSKTTAGATGTLTCTSSVAVIQRFGATIAIAPPTTGAASTAVSVGLTASATITRNADASTAVTAGLTATAALATSGSASTAVTAGLTATATRTANADASTTATAGLTAAATVTRNADSTATVVTAGLSADATATRNAAASTTVTAGLTADATRATVADAATPLTAGLTASASRSTVADATTTTTAGLTATASLSTSIAADTAVTVGLTAAAIIGPSIGATTTVTAALTAAADRTTFGSAPTTVTVGLTAAASVLSGANANITVTTSLTATAAKSTTSTASTAVAVGLTAAATIGNVTNANLAVNVGLTASMTKNANAGVGSVFKRGVSPSMIVKASDGVHATAVYFGDILVWDGTRPVMVQVPVAKGSGLARTAQVATGAIGIAVTATGSAVALPPTPVVTALIVTPPATGSGTSPTPNLDVVAEVATPPALGGGSMPTPGVLVTDDAIAIHVTAIGSGLAPAPTVVVDALVVAPVAQGSGLSPAPVGGVSTTTVVPPAAGSGLAQVPIPKAGATLAVPTALGSGLAPTAAPAAGATPIAVPAAGSGTAPAPTPVIVTAPTAYPVRVPTNGTAHGMRGNTNGAYTVNYPAGSASGDLIIYYFHAYRNDATASTFALDGTWNTLFFEPRAWEGSAAGCYWRFRGSETSVTITPSSNIGTAGHLWSIEAQMNAYQGSTVDPTNPVPVFSFMVDANSGTTTPNAALYTTGPYVELLSIFSANQGSTTPFTSTWTAGATELTDNGGSMVSPANYMSISTAYDRQLAAGNTGSNNVTPSAAVVARRTTLIAIAPVGTQTPSAPTSISTDFGTTAGALDSNFVTYGATPAIHVDSSGYASGWGTQSTPIARAKWFQDFPTGDYEVWAILADIGSQHSSSNLTGRISSDNARGVEFAITQTVVTISSFFDGTERWASSPSDGTGYKLRTPWGSAAPYGGGSGSTFYPEMAQALVVGARIALRCVGTTYSAYIDPPGSTSSSRCWIVKDISDISSTNKRPGFAMQDDNPATSATAGMPSYAGASPPRFSQWGVTAL